jgi:acyl-CoA thioesterase FadM
VEHGRGGCQFRFFEDARIACFGRLGMDVLMSERGVGDDRFTMIYAVFSDVAGLAAHGDGRVVMIDYGTGEKAPIPPSVRQAIDAL